MRVEHYCTSTKAESKAKIWYHKVLRRCSVVVDSLLIVTPIVGVCKCSMFCCTLLFVDSSFAVILMGKRELDALLS